MKHLLKDESLFKQACYVGSSWREAGDGASIEVDNPATSEAIGTVPKLSASEVGEAIDIAHEAFGQWRKLAAEQRGEYLYRWYQAMMDNQEDLASIMTYEQGKPLAEAKAEVAYAASYFKWFAEESPRLYGTVIPPKSSDQKILAQKEPVGVCASITPWNFPLAMLARKAGAALAAGCTMVAKPAKATPFSALAMAELARRSEMPAGVFNVVTGSAAELAEEFTHNHKVRKVTFTGSTQVGRQLLQQSAHHIQKVSLELGGNAPFIVFDDADLEQAVAGLMAAKFRNTGQTCICVNRLFVHASVYDEFCEKLKQAMSELVVGDGFSDDVTQSALINRAAVDKFKSHLQDALDKGAKPLLGAEQPDKGNYVQPCLMRDGNTKMQFCQEETFGPLLVAIAFDSEDQVLAMANETEYGLAGYFYTRDLGRAMRVADELQVGMVGVNAPALSNAAAPFGGVKQSGLGREGSLYGMDEFTHTKYVLLAP